MQLPVHQINSYEKQKKESTIKGSKCFFVLQLYHLTGLEIDTLKEKTAYLGLRLIRFPSINWRKILMPTFKTVGHLPVQISNYALLGENKLSSAALDSLNDLL